jgi:putative membrane protein
MTTAVQPTPAPAPPRRGYHVPTWVGVVVGAVLLGFALLAFGVAVGRRRAARFGDGRFDRFGEHAAQGHRWVFLVIVLLLAAAGIALLVAALRKSRHAAGVPVAAAESVTASASAEQILAERFARGEIDEAEFRTRRDALRT